MRGAALLMWMLRGGPIQNALAMLSGMACALATVIEAAAAAQSSRCVREPRGFQALGTLCARAGDAAQRLCPKPDDNGRGNRPC